MRPVPHAQEGGTGVDASVARLTMDSLAACLPHDAWLPQHWDGASKISVTLVMCEDMVREKAALHTALRKASIIVDIQKGGLVVGKRVPVKVDSLVVAGKNATQPWWWPRMQFLSTVRQSSSEVDVEGFAKGGSFKSFLPVNERERVFWVFDPSVAPLLHRTRPHVLGLCGMDRSILLKLNAKTLTHAKQDDQIRDHWWKYKTFQLARPYIGTAEARRRQLLTVSSVDEIIQDDSYQPFVTERSSTDTLRQAQYSVASAQTPWRELLYSYLVGVLVESRIMMQAPALQQVRVDASGMLLQAENMGDTIETAPLMLSNQKALQVVQSFEWVTVQLLWALSALNMRLGMVHWDLNPNNICVAVDNIPTLTTLILPVWEEAMETRFCKELRALLLPWERKKGPRRVALIAEIERVEKARERTKEEGGTAAALEKEGYTPPLVAEWLRTLDQISALIRKYEEKTKEWLEVSYYSPVRLSLIDFGTSMSRVWSPMGLTAGGPFGSSVQENRYKDYRRQNALQELNNLSLDTIMGLTNVRKMLNRCAARYNQMRRLDLQRVIQAEWRTRTAPVQAQKLAVRSMVSQEPQEVPVVFSQAKKRLDYGVGMLKQGKLAFQVLRMYVGEGGTKITPARRAELLGSNASMGNTLDLFTALRPAPLHSLLADMQPAGRKFPGVERMSDIHYFHKHLSRK